MGETWTYFWVEGKSTELCCSCQRDFAIVDRDIGISLSKRDVFDL